MYFFKFKDLSLIRYIYEALNTGILEICMSLGGHELDNEGCP